MADPSMMSLFGDDGNLFSDELESLGDCGYPSQAQANPMGSAMGHDHQTYGPLSSNIHMPPQAVPGQPKLGPPPSHHYDHFSQYEQQQSGRMLANGPVNGMSSPQSRYHAASTGPAPPGHHGYPGPQGDARAQAFGDGGGGAWGSAPQVVQVSEQGRPPFQSQQQQQQAAQSQHGGSGPQGHGGHQMGPYMGHNDYTMPAHGQTQTPPRMNHFPQSLPQEPSHFMGHVGLQQSSNIGGPPGAPPIRHPAQQPSRHPQPPQQFLHRPSQAGHRPDTVPSAHNTQYPPSPSRQQQQPQQQQVIPGRAHPNMGYNMHSQPVTPNTVTSSGQYPSYPPYGNLNQGLANPSGMSPSMSLNTSSSYPAQGGPPPQQPRYPPTGGPQQGPIHQQQQSALHQINQMNAQPMHPGQNSTAAQQKLQQQQKQQHLPPPQGSYSSPPSMSPMRNMNTPAGTPPPPPPQHSRPSSAGLGPDMVAAGGYPGVPQCAAGNMSLPQRVQQMPHPQQQQLPTQVYNPLSPNHRAQGRTANPSHELPPQQGQSDQRLLSQQPQRVGPQLQSPPMPFQQQQLQQVCPSAALPPPQQTHLAAIHQNSPPSQQPWAPPLQSTPPSQKVPLMQHSPSEPPVEMTTPSGPPTSGCGPSPQPTNCDQQQMESNQKPKKKKKKKAKVSEEEDIESGSMEKDTEGMVGTDASQPHLAEKKSKKKPKEKEPKEPKTPRTPKEPKEKKAKASTTPKLKSSKKQRMSVQR